MQVQTVCCSPKPGVADWKGAIQCPKTSLSVIDPFHIVDSDRCYMRLIWIQKEEEEYLFKIQGGETLQRSMSSTRLQPVVLATVDKAQRVLQTREPT